MKSACAILPLLLIACDSATNPVGNYQATPESLMRSVESNLPSEESTLGKMARERLKSLAEGASSWKVTLELKSDKSFSLAMVLPLAPTRATGTWKRSGVSLELSVTHVNGKALEQPKTATGTIEAGSISLQYDPNSPRFVLEKQPG